MYLHLVVLWVDGWVFTGGLGMLVHVAHRLRVAQSAGLCVRIMWCRFGRAQPPAPELPAPSPRRAHPNNPHPTSTPINNPTQLNNAPTKPNPHRPPGVHPGGGG